MSETMAPADASRQATTNAQRERIRLAAVQLFASQGFAGTSMKQLARDLTMTPGNLYNYFPNKESILFDVLEHQLLRVIERDKATLDRVTGPPEQLYNLARDLVVNDLKDPLAAFVGIQGVKGLSIENLEHISRLMAEIRSRWVMVLSDGVESGDFQVKDVKLCALSMLTLCSSVSTWYRGGGEYTADYVSDEVATMALRIAGCA